VAICGTVLVVFVVELWWWVDRVQLWDRFKPFVSSLLEPLMLMTISLLESSVYESRGNARKKSLQIASSL